MADSKDAPIGPDKPPPGGGGPPPDPKLARCDALAREIAQVQAQISNLQSALNNAVGPHRTQIAAEISQLQGQLAAPQAESKQLGCP
jgi:hypothetical protein